MPTLNQMKARLYSKYPGKAWKKKVDQMTDSQIIAVWYSMQKRKEEDISKSENASEEPLQPSLFKDF